MAEKDSKCKTKFQPPGRRRLQEEVQKVASEKDSEIVKVEFVITTYPELKPFLEMAVLLLEGVYEVNNRNAT